ncbi:hypothetical protein F2Q69_00023288 [Brassica cretica]|uniref:Uncharacterized protein n=1 Tax=Brassica cretica TaxID=69181 RepID=A0A8S9Q1L8_BRACR|nr:hypothetical protein F2Q69_00023288 [Brassica cretica]
MTDGRPTPRVGDERPTSQQSNKNMPDRPTQHHGLEALHDGLTGNPAKVTRSSIRD